MTTVEELVVEMRGEGIDSTANNLDNAESQMNQAGDSMEESAGQMEDFSQKWSGAMGAVVAGLAVASAGLLAQVPVIGGLMESLFSIVQAVAFQMDKVLRPILQPVADAFYDLSGAIFDAEGPMGTIIGIIGTIVAVLLLVAAVAYPIISAIGVLGTVFSALVTVGSLVISALAAIVGALSLPIVVIVALIAAVALLAYFFRDELWAAFMFIVDGIATLVSAFVDMTAQLAGIIGDLISDAVGWGKDLIMNFVKGIKNAAGAIGDAVSDAFSGVKDTLSFDQRENDKMAERWGSDMVGYFGQGMRQSIERELPPIEVDQGETGPVPQKDGRVNVSIDGRDVDKETRRFRDRRISRRGRFS